jgi:hypothetical protein
MKLKKGDKLIFIGFVHDGCYIVKMVFESPAGNKIVITGSGDTAFDHYIDIRVVDEKKLEEELDVK